MIVIFLIFAATLAFYDYVYKHWNYRKKYTFKTVMIYVSLGMLVLNAGMLISYIRDAAEDEEYYMLQSRLNRVMALEAEADYGSMQDTMQLYYDYEPEFEYAWERLEMYAVYNRYQIFQKAAENELGELYVQKAEAYKEELLSSCLEPDYTVNIRYGEDFLRRAKLWEETE